MSNCRSEPLRFIERRKLLKGAAGLAGLPLLQPALAREPNEMLPQAGDRLVYVQGDRKGQVIKVEDLKVGEGQQLALPMEPKTKTVRDANRLGQILLIRLKEDQFSEETKPDTAGGVVAYSAICTHQGCDVSQWKSENRTLLCVCHGSEFDPKDRANVVFGPAPKRLPILPLSVQDGELVVAAAFRGKPGPQAM